MDVAIAITLIASLVALALAVLAEAKRPGSSWGSTIVLALVLLALFVVPFALGVALLVG